ncbi:MAG: phosphoribosyltransferase family protein [Candidatus Eremiobacterota bacterium]
MAMYFEDRIDAGRRLARALEAYRGRSDVLVLALPRGGVPVAAEVARFLGVPMDVLVVRKVGVPWSPELALGAVASGGVLVVNESVLSQVAVRQDELRRAVERERAEVARREQTFRGGRPALEVQGRTVLVVDDGLATGATMRAAVRALQQMAAARVVVAVPVAPPETLQSLQEEADEVVCLVVPRFFLAVGSAYRDFTQVSDDEVTRLLKAGSAI